MNENELINSLIDSVNKLQNRNYDELDGLKRRSEMIIRKVFGETSKYLKDLRGIYFSPSFYPADENSFQKSWLTGKNKMINLFNTMIEELTISKESIEKEDINNSTFELSKRIFVVHGHNEEMKQSIARVLEKQSIDAIILHEQPNKGKTIIEKFENYSDVRAAIILLSGDDYGYTKNKNNSVKKLRPRQNVIFEMGYFIGKLKRENVICLLEKDVDIDILSDYKGVIYLEYDSKGTWRYDIGKELKEMGFNFDLNKI